MIETRQTIDNKLDSAPTDPANKDKLADKFGKKSRKQRGKRSGVQYVVTSSLRNL